MQAGKLGAERILVDRGVDAVDLIDDQGATVVNPINENAPVAFALGYGQAGRVDKVLSGQGLAVGPFGILADVEDPGLAVFRNGRLSCLGVFNLGNKQVNTKLNTAISTLNRGPRGQKASFLGKNLKKQTKNAPVDVHKRVLR